MSNKKAKVCLVSSCGGHFMELMQLLPLVQGSDITSLRKRTWLLPEQ